MNIRRSATVLLFATATLDVVWGQNSEARVRQIILSTRHLGAHGLGYNTRSLWQLSRKLTPADIPVLISLASHDSRLSVGVQFALASQCRPSVTAIREAVEHKNAARRKFLVLDAEDTLQLISEFEGCTPEVRHQAIEVRAELRRLIVEDDQPIQPESKPKADEVRIHD